MQTAIEKANELIQGFCMIENIIENHKFKEDLGFDSLGLTELIIAIEELFAVEFQMDDLNPEYLVTVSDLHALIKKYV